MLPTWAVAVLAAGSAFTVLAVRFYPLYAAERSKTGNPSYD